MNRISRKKDGFTVVELSVVIVIIAILAAVLIVAYSTWKQDTTATTVKSDLVNAATAMESEANFKDTYPASVSSVYTPSEGATASGGAVGTSDYCVSITNQDTSFFMTKQKVALPGTCPLIYFDPSSKKSYEGSGTTIKDMSGNHNDATFRDGLTDNVAGPTYIADDAGGVLEFDGNDKYYSASPIAMGSSTTWTACTKTIQSVSGHNMFMGARLPYFGAYSNGMYVIFSDTIGASQRTVYAASVAIPLNTWNCYAFTTLYDGTSTTMSIYVNGVLQNSGTYPGQRATSSYQVTLGDGYKFTTGEGTWYPYKGRIGDVGVYPRAFNANEVKMHFEALRMKYNI